jgi:hypothetical protein
MASGNYDISFQNYSLEAFFNPTIIEVQKIVLDAMFVLSSLLFPLLVYLLLFRSNRLEFYKYLLLFNVISDYLSDLALTLIQPVFLFPSLAWYANGVFSDLGMFKKFVFFEKGVTISGVGRIFDYVRAES